MIQLALGRDVPGEFRGASTDEILKSTCFAVRLVSAPNQTFAALHRLLLAADGSSIHSGHAKLLSADISATNSLHLFLKTGGAIASTSNIS
ncbi:MAG: hypothetical protein J0I92_02425, partial [Phyllobacterium sp.]|nr:hypothetical protein [Phyllobacterium sp.]